MNHDQIEAQVHNILFGIAVLLTGFGVTAAGSSTTTQVLTIATGVITAIVTAYLSAKTNTVAAVAASASAAAATTPPDTK